MLRRLRPHQSGPWRSWIGPVRHIGCLGDPRRALHLVRQNSVSSGSAERWSCREMDDGAHGLPGKSPSPAGFDEFGPRNTCVSMYGTVRRKPSFSPDGSALIAVSVPPIPPPPSGRLDDLALRAAGTAELSVERSERAAERLRQRDVPGVVAGQAVAQRPYALGEGGEREQRHVESQQILVRAGSFQVRNLAGPFESTQDVGRLGQDRFRAGR